MPFVIKEDQNDSIPENINLNDQPIKKNANDSISAAKEKILSPTPKNVIKTVTVPTARIIEWLGTIPGNTIELPADTTKALYSLMGEEAPEWTEGPSPIRISEEGTIRPGLETQQEARARKPFGEYGEATTPLQQTLSNVADVTGQFLSSGTKGKALLGATTGTLLAREAAKAVEAPPLAKSGLEMVGGAMGMALGSRKPSIQSATQEGKELAQTAQTEGIKSAPGSILSAGRKTPFFTKILKYWGKAGESTRNQAEDFVKEMQTAAENILSEIHLPYKNEKNIDTLITNARSLFGPVKKLTKKFPHMVSTHQLENVINTSISEIKNSKVLSEGSKAALQKLEEMKSGLHKKFFDLSSAVDTYQELNKILGKDILTKGDIKLKNVQKVLKESILDTGQHITGFNEQFLGANEALHEAYKLRDTQKILSNAFSGKGFDIDAFHDIIKDKKNTKKLVEFLGTTNFNRLNKLANLGKEAKKHFEAIEALLPESLKGINKEMGQIISLTSPHALGALLSAAALRSLSAKILTNPNFYNNYLGYIKAIKTNSPKMTAYYLRNIQREMQTESDEKIKQQYVKK
jgi:hypothetical protein